MRYQNVYDSFRYSDYFKTDLPQYWLEKRLGFLAKQDRTAFVDGPFGSDLKSSEYKDSGVPLIQLNNIRDSKHLMQNMKFVTEDKKQELIRHLAIPGDVVIAKMADPVARSAIVANDFSEYVIVADCVKMTPNLDFVDLRYLVWAINCDHVRINAELVSTGTTRIRINLGELKKLKIPYPPYNEQKAIANFLDHETAKIDTLIEKQQQLIKLLKEKRQAVISHAVTKGLNPHAPMRDSGVEWLGEVPEHWSVSKLKYLSDQIVDGAHFTPTYVDDGIPFLRVTDVQSKVIDKSSIKYIPAQEHDELIKRCKPETGDLLLSKNGTIGIPKVVDWDWEFSIFVSLCLIKLNKKLDVHYAYYFFLTHEIREQIFGLIKQSTVINLHLDKIESFVFTIPPLEEQREIVQHLNSVLGKYDLQVDKAGQISNLLKERRTAIISAAVTGKIDVRNWQASNIKEHKVI